MTNKKTLIVGSSGRPGRYAYQAAMLLKENNIDFIPMGIREGEVFGETILNINDSPRPLKKGLLSNKLAPWYYLGRGSFKTYIVHTYVSSL